MALLPFPSSKSSPPSAEGEDLPEVPAADDARRPTRIGLWVLALGFGGFLLWASLAPLDEGVVASGNVSIDTRRETVQHLTGGIVREVLVREGSWCRTDSLSCAWTRRLRARTSKPRASATWACAPCRPACCRSWRAPPASCPTSRCWKGRYNSVLEGIRLDLGSRVHREFRNITEGIARVRALEQAVRSSEQLVTSSQRSQQGGSRTLVDVLNAQQQLGTARRDLAQGRFGYLLSVVRLRSLAGEFGEASINDVNRWLRRDAGIKPAPVAEKP